MKHFIVFTFFSIIIFTHSNLNSQVDHSKVYRIVDEMPVLPSCQTFSSNKERKSCTDTELIKYMKENIHYPDTTGDNNLTDLAIVKFVVNKDGEIINTKIVKNVRGGYADELVRVLHKMNDDNIVWTPGRKGGQNVDVQFYLPMRFKMPAY
jgi:hypothetical protein